MLPHSRYDTPLRHLDYDTINELMNRYIKQNNNIQKRIMDEKKEINQKK